VSERTLVLIKPDGVQRALVGRILSRYEDRGLRIAGLKLVRIDRAMAERHYAEHAAKPFFAALVAYITSGPLVAAAVEGPGAIALVRAMNGATDPSKADPGSIRGDLAVNTQQNLVHASDSPESAARELALWFKPRSCSTTNAASTTGCSAASSGRTKRPGRRGRGQPV
jgi:nucleoside-diphosphate kinase